MTIIYQLLAQCGGIGGYFNSSATYQQPPGAATQTNSTVNFIPFETPYLLISKTPQSQQAGYNGLVSWQLQVRNSGFGTAYNSKVYESIGAGLTFVSFSVNPATTNFSGTNAVFWDASVIPALAGLASSDAPISITVTARVTTCNGDLSNRGDASFGCDSANPCQDTRQNASGALAAIEYLNTRPVSTFSLLPVNPLAVSYCGGVDLTLSVTNNGYANGADAYAVGVVTNLVPGYTLSAPNATYAGGEVLMCGYLPEGASTNLSLHLQPGGACPLDTNLVSQILTPVYSDVCGVNYENPDIALTTYIDSVPSAAIYELQPGFIAGGNHHQRHGDRQPRIRQHGWRWGGAERDPDLPTNNWNDPDPDSISGGGVLNTTNHTISWTTNVIGSGVASLTFQMTVTKGTNL